MFPTLSSLRIGIVSHLPPVSLALCQAHTLQTLNRWEETEGTGSLNFELEFCIHSMRLDQVLDSGLRAFLHVAFCQQMPPPQAVDVHET